MFLLGGVCTGLFSIIHNDCVDARTFTPYALGVSVSIIVGSFFAILVHNRKTKIKEAEEPRYGISQDQLNELALNQEHFFRKRDYDDSESSTKTTPDTSQLLQKEKMEHLLQGYKPTLEDKEEFTFPRYDPSDISDISKQVKQAKFRRKLFESSPKLPPKSPSKPSDPWLEATDKQHGF
jgi:hypothetical protein